MARLYDMAQMTVTSGGAGPITLGAGVAADGITYLTFAQAGAQDQDVVSYRIADGPAWEIGRGTYTAAGTQLGSRTVLLSSAANAAITVSTSATVSIVALAEDFSDTVSPAPITASTTLTQAGATVLTNQFNIVTTAATTTGPPYAGVALPPATVGGHCKVRNSAVNPISVYPFTNPAINVQINQLGANVPITVVANSTAYFESQSATQWFTIP